MTESENPSLSAIKEQVKQALLKEYPENISQFSEEILEQVLQQAHQEAFKNIQVGENFTINGDIIQKIVLNINLPSPAITSNIRQNLPSSGIKKFIGRYSDLIKLHEKLEQQNSIAITAIAGMGGVGKTELALQYALQYQHEYPESICWLKVRDQDLSAQIIEFAGIYLNLFPPEQLKSDAAKVQYCWSRWGEKNSLIILDDIPNFEDDYRAKIEPYLPPRDSRFKVLMTSRQHPETIEELDLDVLSSEAALTLIKTLIGSRKVDTEIGTAQALCKWLGYLPLGLELVGRYLTIHDKLSLAKMLQRLEQQKLTARALLGAKQANITGQLGVAAAFELSWQELGEDAKLLGCYLSLFVPEPFNWSWVENVWIQAEEEIEKEEQIEALENLRDEELKNRSLLKSIPLDQSSTEEQYKLHSLIQEYFRAKLEDLEQKEILKQIFTRPMIAIAQSIPETPTQKDVKNIALAIPHLTNIATELIEHIEDDNLASSFHGLAKFYNGQGLYNQAEQWSKKSLQICSTRLGQEHPDVVTSLHNLAYLYEAQGRYDEAETLYLEALDMMRKLLGQKHPSVATSLNNLAKLYYLQGRYDEAEPLYLKALEMRRKLLGQEHPNVATSLNNLAELYRKQGRYDEAETLSLQALAMRRKLLGQEHPNVATSLNNLAALYESQGRYKAAKPPYLEALAMRRKLLVQEHPDVATSLNNLAELYRKQGKYSESEPLHLEAVEMRRKLLGQEHPDVTQSLNNLAALYHSQGRYDEAVQFFQQALEIAEKALGANHPNTNTIRTNMQRAFTMKLFYMPEEEVKQMFPPETFEQFLQAKRQYQSEAKSATEKP
ncbi:MAG: tetratricopeptide repeat protein [Cyanobacteria bacterium P01_F01_bin.143]